MTIPARNTPRVSVVIPSYNHDRFLQEAIDSVLGQQGVSLELVIIDDGSSDTSWQLIQAAASQDSRVLARRQSNQGAHAAINAGLQLCRGEFLAILNSDDRYHPERLAALVALADSDQGLDFVATGLRLIDQDSEPTTHGVWLDEYQRMRAAAQAHGLWGALLERNFTVTTSNFFFRRSLYEALGPIRPYRYNMDWDYAIRAYLHAPERFAWRDELTLLDYRMHGNNTILRGLPVAAIEVNHLLYRTLKERYAVPGSALASLRRHHRLIRHQQITAVASARDTHWEAELQKAHAGWSATRDAHDQAHERLGQTMTELGATRSDLSAAREAWAASQEQLVATRDDLAVAQRDLAATQQELTITQRELAEVRASRSYRLGMRLTAPLRWLKDRRGAAHRQAAMIDPITESMAGGDAESSAAPASPPAPVYRPLALPEPLAGELPRVAVHLHIHYTDLLDELLDAVSHLPAPFDLFVTTTQPVEAIQSRVLARYPDARVWQCANQGRDVGPFIDALNRYRLDEYELVLKLHGKKSSNEPSYLAAVQRLFGRDVRDGDDWRRKLIAPIAGSTERVTRIYQAFAQDPDLGMVGAAQFICQAPDADPAAYARLCQRLGVSTQLKFFGGTMFWVRGRALSRFLEAGFTLDDFDPAQAREVESTLEHGCERVFGSLVAASGGYLGGLDDPRS